MDEGGPEMVGRLLTFSLSNSYKQLEMCYWESGFPIRAKSSPHSAWSIK